MLAVVPIFASNNPDEGGLYALWNEEISFWNEEGGIDELTLFKRRLSDPIYVFEQIQRRWRMKQLPKFSSEAEARDRLSAELNNLMYQLGWSEGHQDFLYPNVQLSEIFLDLDPHDSFGHVSDYARKGKTVEWGRRLLRLYAYQPYDNIFIIAGGGIKTTRTIQEDTFLNPEFDKLKRLNKLGDKIGVPKSWFINKPFQIEP